MREETIKLYEKMIQTQLIDIANFKKQVEEKNEEIERLKEEYVMLQNASDEVEEDKNKEIARLTAESTKWESKFYDEAKKVDEAIEYIEKNSYTTIETIDDINYFIVRLDKCPDLLDILKGSDKE